MSFPSAFLDELVSRNPIDEVIGQYVHLKRQGGKLFGLCPFHTEKTPSFSVSPDKQLYYCFGCHKGGDVIRFVEEAEGLDYPDAVRFLARRVGLEVPEDGNQSSTYRRQERLRALCKDAARHYRSQLFAPVGEAARAYLVRRGLSSKTVARFGLGFAPGGWNGLEEAMREKGYEKEELLAVGLLLKGQKGGVYDRFRNRLMFPIIDVSGNVIGFGGRVMDDSKPKYLNSPENLIFNKRKNLFALNIAKNSKQGRIILTEGYMDAIALHQYGFDCAVASLGTSLTEEHALILQKYTKQVVITYDGDQAGQDATRRAISLLEKSGVEIRVLRMQGAKDPDEFLKQYGPDRFRLLLDQSENHAAYGLESIRRKFDLSRDDQRVEFLREAARYVAGLPGAVEREIYGARAAELAKVTTEAVKHEVEQAFRQKKAREKRLRQQKDLAPAAAQQPQSRKIRYDNVRSAVAEEKLLAMLLKEPALFERCGGLTGGQFSSELLGRTYEMLKQRRASDLQVSLAGLGEALSEEELSHLSGVADRHDELVSDRAMDDCLRIIREEYEKTHIAAPTDLLEMRRRLQEKKAYGGTKPW